MPSGCWECHCIQQVRVTHPAVRAAGCNCVLNQCHQHAWVVEGCCGQLCSCWLSSPGACPQGLRGVNCIPACTHCSCLSFRLHMRCIICAPDTDVACACVCVCATDDSRDALSQLKGMLQGAAGVEEAMIRCVYVYDRAAPPDGGHKGFFCARLTAGTASATA